jgi:hypothetical protein
VARLNLPAQIHPASPIPVADNQARIIPRGDGTLIPIDRVAADRPFYSGKHRRHGMNLQVIASPAGDIIWVSGLLPGAVHDLTAARIWGIVRDLAACGLVVLADKGYTGAGEHIRTPCPPDSRDARMNKARSRRQRAAPPRRTAR